MHEIRDELATLRSELAAERAELASLRDQGERMRLGRIEVFRRMQAELAALGAALEAERLLHRECIDRVDGIDRALRAAAATSARSLDAFHADLVDVEHQLSADVIELRVGGDRAAHVDDVVDVASEA